MKNFEEPTLELISLPGDVITQSPGSIVNPGDTPEG